MEKAYLIFGKNTGYMGFTTSKKLLKLFKKQRDIKRYEITELCYDEINNTEIHDEQYEMHEYNKIVIFPSEGEYLFEVIEYIISELRHSVPLLLYSSQFLRLNNYEKQCIDNMGLILKKLLSLYEDDKFQDDPIPHIFNIPTLISRII